MGKRKLPAPLMWVRASPEMAAELGRIAEAENVTRAAVVRHAVQEFIEARHYKSLSKVIGRAKVFDRPKQIEIES